MPVETMDAYASPAGDAFRAPKCTPVTLYQSEEKPPAESASSQLAACDGFLAYAIKGGKMGVLARGWATRTLLRGHWLRMLDVAFGVGGAGALLLRLAARDVDADGALGAHVAKACVHLDVEAGAEHVLVHLGVHAGRDQHAVFGSL